ncbi:hypothetical protein [Deinococcus pimensis]|uniref:hypothetical protein n=1 Tax=Deinococcus pimensis TaxID=309888 RepID=UPI000489A36A|nr:hypothetical protein [Deinococcus pimensis]
MAFYLPDPPVSGWRDRLLVVRRLRELEREGLNVYRLPADFWRDARQHGAYVDVLDDALEVTLAESGEGGILAHLAARYERHARRDRRRRVRVAALAGVTAALALGVVSLLVL